jgi:hypothetical protein
MRPELCVTFDGIWISEDPVSELLHDLKASSGRCCTEISLPLASGCFRTSWTSRGPYDALCKYSHSKKKKKGGTYFAAISSQPKSRYKYVSCGGRWYPSWQHIINPSDCEVPFAMPVSVIIQQNLHEIGLRFIISEDTVYSHCNLLLYLLVRRWFVWRYFLNCIVCIAWNVRIILKGSHELCLKK